MNVAVVEGGFSREREISLRSGKRITEALKSLGIQTWTVDPGKEEKWLESLQEADLAFIALHGHFGEDGKIQSILKEWNIPFTGSKAYSCAMTFNKVLTKQLLIQHRFLTPEYDVFELGAQTNALKNLAFPAVLKPIEEGSSLDTYVIDHPKELAVYETLLKDQYPIMLFERFVQGRELSISYLNGRILPILEIIPKHRFYDYPCKYTPGMAKLIAPASIGKFMERKITRLCLEVFELFQIQGFARLDGILTDKDFFILEINAIPGMTDTSDLPASAHAAGMTFTQLVREILDYCLFPLDDRPKL